MQDNNTQTKSSSEETTNTNEPNLVRHKKRSHKKRNKRIKIIIGIVFAIIVVICVAFGANYFLMNQGEDNLKQDTDNINIETPDNAVSYNQGKTLEYNGHTYEYNEDIVTVCFMGYDSTEKTVAEGKNGQADAIIVFAMDTETGKTRGIVIPRDSYVEVGQYAGSAFAGIHDMQICLAFAYGTDVSSGAQYVTNVASRVLYNVPITQYFAMDLSGVGALANAVGGVTLTPIQTVQTANAYEGTPTVLFGSNALNYVQYRDTKIEGSSLDRQARQEQFVSAWASAALSQALSEGGASVLINLFNTALDYSTTTLGLSEVTYLANSLIQNGISSFDLVSLQGTMDSSDTYAKFYLDSDDVFNVVLDTFYTQID